MALKRAVCFMKQKFRVGECSSTSESVQSFALSLQSIDDIHGSDSLSLGVLGVSDGISDDILKEDLKN